MSLEKAKDAAGFRALEFVREGMLIGLGTGSTAACFIRYLIEKCKEGFQVHAVATSIVSENMAREGGIELLDSNQVTHLDLTIDGADEIDPQKQLIKGAGGALVREKIIARMSRQMIVIADETKCVKRLGNHRLPVEVIPFGSNATKEHISSLGLTGDYRKGKDGKPYVTDNHNWIFDITFSTFPDQVEKLHDQLIQIPGIVDTGFFFNLATKVIVGKANGTTNILE